MISAELTRRYNDVDGYRQSLGCGDSCVYNYITRESVRCSCSSGWVPNSGLRSTIDIVWSCVTTLVLCSWSILHLNIPSNAEKTPRTIWRQIRWTFFALLLPDLLVGIAAYDFFQAWHIRKITMAKKHKLTWAQIYFVLAGGFRMIDSDKQKRVLHLGRSSSGSHKHEKEATQIIALYTEFDTQTEKAILDASSTNYFIKAISFIQVMYFFVQFLARIPLQYAATSLESGTFAIVVLSVFTYFFWFNKPLNPRRPIILEFSDRCLQANSDFLTNYFRFQEERSGQANPNLRWRLQFRDSYVSFLPSWSTTDEYILDPAALPPTDWTWEDNKAPKTLSFRQSLCSCHTRAGIVLVLAATTYVALSGVLGARNSKAYGFPYSPLSKFWWSDVSGNILPMIIICSTAIWIPVAIVAVWLSLGRKKPWFETACRRAYKMFGPFLALFMFVRLVIFVLMFVTLRKQDVSVYGRVLWMEYFPHV